MTAVGRATTLIDVPPPIPTLGPHSTPQQSQRVRLGQCVESEVLPKKMTGRIGPLVKNVDDHYSVALDAIVDNVVLYRSLTATREQVVPPAAKFWKVN